MELAVEKRTQFGRALTALRERGFIPAELYGRGVENLHLSVREKDFTRVFREAGESALVTIAVNGDKRPVMIHDVSFDPVTDEVMSVDFYQVRLDEKIRVKVPLEFTGDSAAVKAGGVLVRAMQELEVESLPAEIPHAITVDLNALTEIGTSIYVEHLSIPKSAKVFVDPKTVVATITAKMTEEEEQKLSAEVSVDAVKVEAEEKKAERDVKEGKEGKEAKETAEKAGETTAPKA